MIHVSYNLPVATFRLVESEEFIPRPRYDQRRIGVREVLRQVTVGHFQTVAFAAPHFELASSILFIPLAPPTSNVHGLVTFGRVTFLRFGKILPPEAVTNCVNQYVAPGQENVVLSFVTHFGEFVDGV